MDWKFYAMTACASICFTVLTSGWVWLGYELALYIRTLRLERTNGCKY